MIKVLVVDDVADNVKLLSYDLADQGYDVLAAYSGRQALEIANARHPDVILLDIMMPEMDGIETCRRLKDDPELRTIPVIMVSAKNQDEDVVQGLDAGAHDYVTKPFDARIVAARVRAAVRVKQADDENRQLLEEVKAANAELDAIKNLLEEKNRCLSELNKMAYQFVDNVSHEFRTPLTVIKEFASIIHDGLAGQVNNEQREYLDIVGNRVDDLAIMVDDMLDISKLEAGMLGIARRECSVYDIIEHVRTTLDRKAVAGKINLNIETGADLPNIYCDREKIGRVIINLVVNALKFSDEGGEVTLWARRDTNNAQVVIGVTDNGSGIAPENVRAIFERFRQIEGNARASTKGFGLGLNIANELVHLNFGEINVESELGKGSTFSFTVPIHDPVKLIPRYLEHFRNGSTHVSLLSVSIDPATEASLAAETEQFIQRRVRRGDLLFRAAHGRWLLVVATSQGNPDEIIDQLRDNQREANRNRPGEALPDIDLQVVGTWRVSDESGEFIRQFEAALQTAEPING